VDALTRVDVPHSHCPVSGAANNNIVLQLRCPHTASVSDKGLKQLASEGAPDFERAVVRAGDNAEAVELEACDDVVVVAAQDEGLGQGAGAPVARDVVVDEKGAFEGVERLQVGVERGLDEGEKGLTGEKRTATDCVVEVRQRG